MRSFSRFVKEEREKMNFSQAKLAEELGVAWITVWRWENGKARPDDSSLDFYTKQIEELKAVANSILN